MKYKIGDYIKITDLRNNHVTTWHIDRIEGLNYVMTGMLWDGSTQKDVVNALEMETYLNNAISNGIAKISVSSNSKQNSTLPYLIVGGLLVGGIFLILKK